MAVVENGGITKLGSSSNHVVDTVDGLHNDVSAGDHHHHHRHHHQSAKTMTSAMTTNQQRSTESSLSSGDQSFHVAEQQQKIMTQQSGSGATASHHHHQQPLNNRMLQDKGDPQQRFNGVEMQRNDGVDKDLVKFGSEDFKREMRDLEEMLSKLNPMAEEFVPPSMVIGNHQWLLQPVAGHFGYTANSFLMSNNGGIPNGIPPRRKKSGSGNGNVNGKRRLYSRTGMAQQEEVIRRTVYVSDIDHQVTEEQLAALFLHCGQVVDCRICGDPNSVLRFAFVEFTDEVSASNALNLAGTVLGFYPVKVLPSKTAIAPVNPTFLPQSEEEREMCARTIYCTNIDKKVTHAEVRLFFESLCGKVERLRMLGDNHHPTRIAFVEFVMAESAIAALNCSGSILGSLPLRISPSKTPVRPGHVRQSVR